jgi:hypothetical protein
MPLGEFVGKGLETIIEQQKTTILKKWKNHDLKKVV